MTTTKTISHSKWIAAAIALVFMCTAFAVVSDSSDAAEDDIGTLDFDAYFGQAVAGVYERIYAEVPSSATVISGSHNVTKDVQRDALFLNDGAVLSFSDSAVLTVNTLFINGTVKFINKDGSSSAVNANAIYLSNYLAIAQPVQITTDKSVTVTSNAEDSGFYDPDTGAFDASKDIKVNSSIVVDIESNMTIADSPMGTVVFSSGDNVHAISAVGSIDMTDMYKSLKENLDGIPFQDLYTKLADYMYNKLVYPEIDIKVEVADVSNSAAAMEGVTFTVTSGQSSKMVEAELKIGSSEGSIQCTNLDAGFSLSVLKAKIYASVDSLIVERAQEGTDEPSKVTLTNMDTELSTRGDKFIQVILENYNANDPQAIIDAIANSDMELSGDFVLSADKFTSIGYQTYNSEDGPDGYRNVVAEDFSINADVDTKTGTDLDIDLGKLDFSLEATSGDKSYHINDFKADLTTSEKNILRIFKFITVTPSTTEGERPSFNIDTKGALIDLLDGATAKGDISIESFQSAENDVVSIEERSLTGGTGDNFSMSIDAKFATSAENSTITMTADLDPKFSDKAKLYVKDYQEYEGAYEGQERTLSNIKLDLETVTVTASVSESGAAPQVSMPYTMTADVEENSWNCLNAGAAANGQAIKMSSAVLNGDFTSLYDPKSLFDSGRDISITHYKVASPGTDAIKSFADLVAKPNVADILKGSEFKTVYDDQGALSSLSTANTVTTIEGKEVKYTEVSDTKPVAHLVTGTDGFYDISADAGASGTPVYNMEATPEPSSGGDNTMLYIAIAIIAIIAIALIAYFLMKKRNA